MRRKFGRILKFLLFLLVGVFIFWLVYRKQDTAKIFEAFSDVNVFWLSMSVFVMLVSHLSRSFRWMMLIEPLGKKVTFKNATLTTFLGYFANMALPRMGEVTRCAVLGKYENIPTSKLLGTVVMERAIDLLMFLLCFVLALVLQFDTFIQLGKDYFARSSENQDSSYTGLYIFVGIVALLVLLFYIFRPVIVRTQMYKKGVLLLADIAEGIRSVRKLRNFYSFVFHSILIWVSYFLMMYFGFKIFDFSENLSPIVALSIFVLGSLGMILPSPGGLGSFHFFVISGLVLYLPHTLNINEKAAAFALLVHGIQTIFIMIAGILSLILLPLLNQNQK